MNETNRAEGETMNETVVYKRALREGEVDDGVRIELPYGTPTETAQALATALNREFVSGSAAFGGLRSATVLVDGVNQAWVGRVFV